MFTQSPDTVCLYPARTVFIQRRLPSYTQELRIVDSLRCRL